MLVQAGNLKLEKKMKTQTQQLKFYDPKKYAVCGGTGLGPCQQHVAPPLLEEYRQKYPGGGQWSCPDCEAYLEEREELDLYDESY